MKKITYLYKGVPVNLGEPYDVVIVEDGISRRYWGNHLTKDVAEILVSNKMLERKEEKQEYSFSESLRTIDQNDGRLNAVISYLYDFAPAIGVSLALKAFSNAMTAEVGEDYFPAELWFVSHIDGSIFSKEVASKRELRNVAWFLNYEDAKYACTHIPNLFAKAYNS